MNFQDFQRQFKDRIVIRKSDILQVFSKFDNKNLVYWQKKWYIKKLINWFYYFSDLSINEVLLFFISNNIYHPSYISTYSAFSYYGIIPEQVFSITAVTTNITKKYDTNIWFFSYQNIKENLFWWYNVIEKRGVSIYFADIEKAILDFFYLNKRYKTKEDIEGLRFNADMINNRINIDKLNKYLKIFNNKSLNKKIDLFLNVIKDA